MVEKLKSLSLILAQSGTVNSHDDPDEPESSRLAYSLLELQGSFEKLSKEMIPQMSSGDIKNEEELDDLLNDIGEEFRHILYHIHDPKYFRYLKED